MKETRLRVIKFRTLKKAPLFEESWIREKEPGCFEIGRNLYPILGNVDF